MKWLRSALTSIQSFLDAIDWCDHGPMATEVERRIRRGCKMAGMPVVAVREQCELPTSDFFDCSGILLPCALNKFEDDEKHADTEVA